MFIINWLIMYCAIMFAMCIDNIFWISASPEYIDFKKWSLKKKISYIFTYRVKTVLTHWRDIIPAIITSFIITLIYMKLI